MGGLRPFRGDYRRDRLGRIGRAGFVVGIDLDRGPAGDLVGTGRVLVAADVEPGVVFLRQAVFADVGVAMDLDNGAEADVTRAGDGVTPAANIGARSGDARGLIGLARYRIVTGYHCPDGVMKGRRLGAEDRR